MIDFLIALVPLLLLLIPLTLTGWLLYYAARTTPRAATACARCGYDLSNLGDRHACPECGQPFHVGRPGEIIG